MPGNQSTEMLKSYQNLSFRFADFFNTGKGGEDDSSKSKSCTECGQTFVSNGVLDLHWQKIHEAPSLMQCADCGTDFRRKMALIAHYRMAPAHRLPDCAEDKLIGCDICDAFNIVNGFLNEKELLNHTKAIHGKDVIVNAFHQSKYYCPLPSCSGEFAYRKGMIEHFQILHCDHLLGHLLGLSGSIKDRLMEEMHYKCNFCSKVYRVEKSLSQHLSQRHGDHKGLNNPQRSPTAKKIQGMKTQSRPEGSGKSDTDFKGNITKKILPENNLRNRPKRTTSNILKMQKFEDVKCEATTPLTQQPAKKIKTESVEVTPVQVAPSPSKDCMPSSPCSEPVTCDICQKTFSRYSVLSVHSQMVHGKPSPLSTPSKNNHLSPTKVNQGTSQALASTAELVKKNLDFSNFNEIISSVESAKKKSSRPLRSATKKSDEVSAVSVQKEESKKPRNLEKLFDEAYFKNVDSENKAAIEFYGKDSLLKEEELEETCYVDGCKKKFFTYFSMMRHIAFHHYPAATAKQMKLD